MFYIDTDNIVKITGLKDAETGAYVNKATITGIVYILPSVSPTALGAATQVGVYTGIPCVGHGFVVGDCIRFEKTANFDGEYTVQVGTTVDIIVINKLYVHEVFDGTELMFKAVVGSVSGPITFRYIDDSDGDYVCKIPNDSPFEQDLQYMLCIKEIHTENQVFLKIVDYAGYKGL